MNDNDFKEERFDSFLNKTIKLSAKWYARTYNKISFYENLIIDDEMRFSNVLDDIAFMDTSCSNYKLEEKIDLLNAKKSLSAIEQAVIFYLYEEELSQEEAAKLLEICSRTVRRRNKKALEELRKYLKGDYKYDY